MIDITVSHSLCKVHISKSSGTVSTCETLPGTNPKNMKNWRNMKNLNSSHLHVKLLDKCTIELINNVLYASPDLDKER